MSGQSGVFRLALTAHRVATGDHEYYLKDGTPPSKWDRWMRSGVIPESLLPFGSGDLLGQLSEEVCYHNDVL